MSKIYKGPFTGYHLIKANDPEDALYRVAADWHEERIDHGEPEEVEE